MATILLSFHIEYLYENSRTVAMFSSQAKAYHCNKTLFILGQNLQNNTVYSWTKPSK